VSRTAQSLSHVALVALLSATLLALVSVVVIRSGIAANGRAADRWPSPKVVTGDRWPSPKSVTVVGGDRWPGPKSVTTIAGDRWPGPKSVTTVAGDRWPGPKKAVAA